MQTNVLLPQVELTTESATIAKWLVAEGDHVRAEQPLLEVETQKATSDVPSPAAGFVRQLCVKEGDPVSANALLCILTDAADEPLELRSSEHASHTAVQPTSSPARLVLDELPAKATPAARRVARELGVELSGIAGMGPGGRITEEDVRRVAAVAAPPASRDGTQAADSWTPLPAARVALIAQMQKSLAEIPQIHLQRQMDVSRLDQKADGITFTHRLIVAAAAALAKHPALRTVIKEDKVKVEPVSIAVAMDSPYGLIAPAVRAADQLSVEQVAATVKELRDKARNNTLRREEITNAPFALSNLGVFDVDFFNAFVFHGQTAVLSVGRMTDDDGGNRKLAWMGLAVDHRVVDGAEAARFLQTLQAEIQRP